MKARFADPLQKSDLGVAPHVVVLTEPSPPFVDIGQTGILIDGIERNQDGDQEDPPAPG